MKKIFFTFYFLLFPFFCFSQDIKFTRIGSDQGLSQASVNCILEDSKGYMWFGTQDGLNRYDGYEMKVFKNNPLDTNSLSDNWIICLYEDKKGVIWIGTHSGLNSFNPLFNTFVRFQNDTNKSNSLSNNFVNCITQDKNGTYWIGTYHGLNSFNGNTNSFKKFIHKDDDSLSLKGFNVQNFYEDKKGNFWIITLDGGLNLFNRAKKTAHSFSDVTRGVGSEFFNRTTAIAEDESGILWLATDNGGVVLFNPEYKKFIQRFLNSDKDPNSISDDRVSSLCVDGKNIWLGTESEGLNCFHASTEKFHHYNYDEYDPQSLSNDAVNCIYRDREGNIWIGTEAGGVNVCFPQAIKFKHYHRDPSNENAFLANTVFAIMQDHEGTIWAGTLNGGIVTIDRANKVYKNYGDGTPNSLSSAENNSVLSLFEDERGRIWVGTNGAGLNLFDKKKNKIISIIPRGSAMCITQGYGGNIWIAMYGTDIGLYAYNENTNSLNSYSTKNGLSTNDANCVYEDKERRVWIGTIDGGLNVMNATTKKVKVYKHSQNKNSPSSNTIYSIYDDRKGNLWLGTSNGLDKFNIASQTFLHYYEKDGLPNSCIDGILADKKGNLWLSTNKGLSRFNPNVENNTGTAFKNFSINDGLQADEFASGSYFENKKTGEIFFGGINGFNSFFPDNISDNKHIPPVYISSFKKFGKEDELDSSISNKKYIELSYKDNFVSFEFVSLDFTYPSRNQYSFMMEGLDDDWSPPSTRHYVSYTNLPGGDYIFHVKASNSDGVWNETGTELHIKVIPPWWKTNTFYFLCVLFTVGFIFGFIRYRTAAIHKEKKILEQKVEERTAELAQKNKDITSSIQYAKRIQDAILPTKEQIQKYFPDSFVLFKPKDIVSGDFYWFGEKNGKKIAACVDCTGHGVPGAFMSMIGTNLLNQIILENGITEPAAILSALNFGVRSALKQGIHSEIETTDGMDIALITLESGIQPTETTLQFSSAQRHLIIIFENKIEKIDGNKFPIGGAQIDTERNFSNNVRSLKKESIVYMFSDGYADQFGGEKGKKFMIKRLHEMLLSINTLPLNEQKLLLDKEIENWKGNHSQVDDILVIGIRV